MPSRPREELAGPFDGHPRTRRRRCHCLARRQRVRAAQRIRGRGCGATRRLRPGPPANRPDVHPATRTCRVVRVQLSGGSGGRPGRAQGRTTLVTQRTRRARRPPRRPRRRFRHQLHARGERAVKSRPSTHPPPVGLRAVGGGHHRDLRFAPAWPHPAVQVHRPGEVYQRDDFVYWGFPAEGLRRLARIAGLTDVEVMAAPDIDGPPRLLTIVRSGEPWVRSRGVAFFGCPGTGFTLGEAPHGYPQSQTLSPQVPQKATLGLGCSRRPTEDRPIESPGPCPPRGPMGLCIRSVGRQGRDLGHYCGRLGREMLEVRQRQRWRSEGIGIQRLRVDTAVSALDEASGLMKPNRRSGRRSILADEAPTILESRGSAIPGRLCPCCSFGSHVFAESRCVHRLLTA